ncbi:FG-GAP-like repeat-containing protein [Streptomyces sp. NPDC048275]|uniref:FG-GAP-like repeat-containing protein n=1 Tax=Streptomyces sp. NPDC048275 TaxID=3155629 RepID=UPI00340E7029
MRKRTLLLAATLTTGLLTTLTLPATTAAAAPSGLSDDFNGDGYRDLAVGDGGATVAGKKQAGAIVVIWGTATGLAPAKRTVVSQNTPYVAGAAETNDHFGTDITTVDLNKDGYGDIIATAPGEDAGAYNGTFTVLWGSKSGLTSGSSYRNPKHKDRGFASDIAVGDFNADGKQDVVAVDDTNIWYLRGPFTKSGSRGTATDFDPVDGENIDPVLVVSGKVTKDGTADFAVLGRDWDTDSDRVWFYKGGSGGPKKTKKVTLPASAALTEASATIADFDKNGYGDLVVGSRRAGKGGAVHVLPGTSNGPSGSAKKFTQATSGVPGTPESADYFGSDVSAADTNADGYPDLAVGVSGEVIGDNWFRMGGVTVLRGGTSGLTGKNSRMYDYATAGVEGEPGEENDAWFGDSVLLRDYTRDGRAELVAASSQNGRLHILPGSASGPTGTGSKMLTLTSLGLQSLTKFWAELAD